MGQSVLFKSFVSLCEIEFWVEVARLYCRARDAANHLLVDRHHESLFNVVINFLLQFFWFIPCCLMIPFGAVVLQVMSFAHPQ